MSRAEDLGFTRFEFGEMLDVVICRAHSDGCNEKERQQFLNGMRLDELVFVQACARGSDKGWESGISTRAAQEMLDLDVRNLQLGVRALLAERKA